MTELKHQVFDTPQEMQKVMNGLSFEVDIIAVYLVGTRHICWYVERGPKQKNKREK